MVISPRSELFLEVCRDEHSYVLSGRLLSFNRLSSGQTKRSWIADLEETSMLTIPRRHSHFVFGVIQSGMTSLIAAAVASFPLVHSGGFLRNVIASWLISWSLMLPVVLFAAPLVRSLAIRLTRE